MSNLEPVAFLRDLDGEGLSFHPCAPSDPGAFPVYADPAAPDLLNELEVREGDIFMLIKAVEAGDPKAELLIRLSDMLRETRAAIAKATSLRPVGDA